MSDRLRILIVDCLPGPVRPVGGLERRLLNWATHLGQQHDVTLGSLARPSDTPGKYVVPGELFTRCLFADLDDLHAYTNTVDALSVHQWYEWVTNPGKTLFMLHSGITECFPAEFAVGTDSPEWQSVVHGIGRPRVVATCSDYASATVKSHVGREAVTLHSGIHPAFFAVASAAPKEPVIGFHGRLARSKGVPMLLDLAESGALYPYTLELTALSPDPAVLARAQHLEAAGHPVKVIDAFTSPREQAVHLARCAVSVMPSRMEGFGTAAIESQAAGTRVVAYAVGGLTEAVQPDGGALVALDDTDEFLNQIHTQAGQPVPNSVRGFLEETFSLPASAERYLNALRAVA